MKRSLVGFFSMLATTLLVAAPGLCAQNRLDAYVPFDFSAGQKVMVEGNYRVSSISESLDLVQNEATHSAAYLIKAVRVQSAGEHGPMLVFHRFGNQYFLSEIWDGRSSLGIRLPESKREKELSEEARLTNDGPQTVIVAMNWQ